MIRLLAKYVEHVRNMGMANLPAHAGSIIPGDNFTHDEAAVLLGLYDGLETGMGVMDVAVSVSEIRPAKNVLVGRKACGCIVFVSELPQSCEDWEDLPDETEGLTVDVVPICELPAKAPFCECSKRGA